MKSSEKPTRKLAAKPLSRAELASLQQAAGRKVNVLRVARGDTEIVVAIPEALCVRAAGEWQFRRWETILFGGWKDELDQLYWTLLDGTEEFVTLAQPADLPFVFADRLRASIVATRGVELGDDLGTVTLAGRRPPTELDQEIVWTVQATPQTDLNDPRVQAAVVAEMARLREEFE